MKRKVFFVCAKIGDEARIFVQPRYVSLQPQYHFSSLSELLRHVVKAFLGLAFVLTYRCKIKVTAPSYARGKTRDYAKPETIYSR